KFTVLFLLLSSITAAPMLLIFILKSSLVGSAWIRANTHLAFASVVGSLVWVTLIALVSLASSAWVRWRPAAAGMMFALFFIPTGFGAAANQIMRMGWGTLLNSIVVIGTVWNSLFFIGDPEGYNLAARVLNPDCIACNSDPIPAWSAWFMVGL